MAFMRCGFTSGGQESGSMFSTAVCEIQASKRYIESLPLVLKDNEAASHKVKGFLYNCLLIMCLPSGSRTLHWHLETIYIHAHSFDSQAGPLFGMALQSKY